MAKGISRGSSASDDSDWVDPRVDVTVNAVNWDALLEIACKVLQVHGACWGNQVSGGYNLIRFLELNDSVKTIVIVRVPLHPEEGATERLMKSYCNLVASEVATMQYIEAYTSIPVPHILHFSVELDESEPRPGGGGGGKDKGTRGTNALRTEMRR